MIKTIDNNDINEILDFLYKQDSKKYLFLISDIEQFGLNNENVKTYVIKNKDSYNAIFLKFYTNLVVFYDGKTQINKNEFYKLVKENNINNFIFCYEFYEFFFKFIDEFQIKQTLYTQQIATLHQLDFEKNVNLNDLKAKEIELQDLEKVIEGRLKIKEFGGLSNQTTDINYLKKSFNDGYYFGYIKYNNQKNEIMSHAAISAKNKKVAMIGGVYTVEEYRRQGHAQDCVISLCNEIFRRKMTPILFFSNPNAASMYYKLGFKDYDKLYVSSVSMDEK
ncbi:GNAT family N-acetyltransferase [Mycoplasma leonicaptivi]|uniref:GNAT family N-acetyltransferase n=1 Tax=Mycoplasma leonicaptivi TaxID=36742 RepID=UPI000480BF00|nr:GNAT family N-acetyltransferase [Mycoplasma leonicaptivi]